MGRFGWRDGKVTAQYAELTSGFPVDVLLRDIYASNAGTVTIVGSANTLYDGTSLHTVGYAGTQLDVPRNIRVRQEGKGGASKVVSAIDVYGYNQFGDYTIERFNISTGAAIIANGNVAWSKIGSIMPADDYVQTAGTISIYAGDKIGLPYPVKTVPFLMERRWTATSGGNVNWVDIGRSTVYTEQTATVAADRVSLSYNTIDISKHRVPLGSALTLKYVSKFRPKTKQ